MNRQGASATAARSGIERDQGSIGPTTPIGAGSLQVRYVYSACVVMSSPDLRLLCDPWFTPGAYDGAWYAYPPIKDPIEVIGECDLVYISHVHPDHYDPAFLRAYLARYPRARVIIGRCDAPILASKMRADGIQHEVVSQGAWGRTETLIEPNRAYAINVDTALAIRHGDASVVNMNDNPIDAKQIAALRAFCPQGRPSLALLPYAGAGPYPQTFEFPDREALNRAANDKRDRFLSNYAKLAEMLDAKACMPFAGKYYLGGTLAHLNQDRGVPDAVEALDRVPASFVLADGGHASYDVATGKASALRTKPYEPEVIARHLAAVACQPFAYERELLLAADRPLPLLPLLNLAKRRARSFVSVQQDFWIALTPIGEDDRLLFNVADDEDARRVTDAVLHACTPRAEISIDRRLLFGLLTRLYHWNNAEIGSHYRTRRVPDIYRREVYDFLDFLQV